MLDVSRYKRLAAAILSAVAVLAISSLPSSAETGTVRFRVGKAGFIIGVGGGSGVLHFKGKTYPLRVDGLSAGVIGVSQMDLVGTASHLRTPTDIAGSYSAVGAGIAVAGGVKTVRLANGKGVVLELRGRQVGFEASLNLSGVTVSMQ